MASAAHSIVTSAAPPTISETLDRFETVSANLDSAQAVLEAVSEEISFGEISMRGQRLLCAAEFAIARIQADFSAAIDAALTAARP